MRRIKKIARFANGDLISRRDLSGLLAVARAAEAAGRYATYDLTVALDKLNAKVKGRK